MPATQYFVRRGEKQFGPFTAKQLKQLATSKKLKSCDLVSSDGEKWVQAYRISGLSLPSPTSNANDEGDNPSNGVKVASKSNQGPEKDSDTPSESTLRSPNISDVETEKRFRAVFRGALRDFLIISVVVPIYAFAIPPGNSIFSVGLILFLILGGFWHVGRTGFLGMLVVSESDLRRFTNGTREFLWGLLFVTLYAAWTAAWGSCLVALEKQEQFLGQLTLTKFVTGIGVVWVYFQAAWFSMSGRGRISTPWVFQMLTYPSELVERRVFEKGARPAARSPESRSALTTTQKAIQGFACLAVVACVAFGVALSMGIKPGRWVAKSEIIGNQDSEFADIENQAIRIVAWNIESSGSDGATIARQLTTELGRYDIYALTEVSSSNTYLCLESVRKEYGDAYTFSANTVGLQDKVVIFDGARLELLRPQDEAVHFFMDDSSRGLMGTEPRLPLAFHFRDKHTQADFMVVLNHFADDDVNVRQRESKGLRLWAADQPVTVFGVGVYNFDFDFVTRKGNAAFDEFLADETWELVEPDELIDSCWSDSNDDGTDDSPNVCSDLTFMSRAAAAAPRVGSIEGPSESARVGQWKAKSRVIVRDGDFPDDHRTSDHRPIELVVYPE